MKKSSARLVMATGQLGDRQEGQIYFTNKGDVIVFLGESFMAVSEVLDKSLRAILRFVFRTRRALMLRGYRVQVFNTLPPQD